MSSVHKYGQCERRVIKKTNINIDIFLRNILNWFLGKNSKNKITKKDNGINIPMILDEVENAQKIEKIIKFKLFFFF